MAIIIIVLIRKKAYYLFREKDFAIPSTLIFLGDQMFSPKKWSKEYQICEIEQKSQVPLLLPRF